MSYVLIMTYEADDLIDAQQKAQSIATAADGTVVSLRPEDKPPVLHMDRESVRYRDGALASYLDTLDRRNSRED